MCGILESVRSNKTMTELFEAMKDSCYLRLDGRPVLYLYGVDDWTAENVEKVRKQAVLAGIRESLYVVGREGGKALLDTLFIADVCVNLPENGKHGAAGISSAPEAVRPATRLYSNI